MNTQANKIFMNDFVASCLCYHLKKSHSSNYSVWNFCSLWTLDTSIYPLVHTTAKPWLHQYLPFGANYSKALITPVSTLWCKLQQSFDYTSIYPMVHTKAKPWLHQYLPYGAHYSKDLITKVSTLWNTLQQSLDYTSICPTVHTTAKPWLTMLMDPAYSVH